MKKKWNLYSISESRAIIMGFATLIVALFHSYSLKYSSVFNYIRNTGNVGVDIFLFVSAIGLYFSFTKNSNIKEFYKKRILRILPAILIVRTIYCIWIQTSFWVYIKNITLSSLFIDGNRDLWYFTLSIILYLLYPLLYKVINSKGLKGLIGLLLVTIGSSLLLYYFNYNYYLQIEILLTRIPVFLIGIYVGKMVYEKKEINNLWIIPFILMFFITNILMYRGGINPYMVVRYLYCLLGISIVFIIAFCHSLWNHKNIDKVLAFFGMYSMEVYLIYERMCYMGKGFVPINNIVLFYIVIFIISVLLSVGLKMLENRIVGLFEDRGVDHASNSNGNKRK